MSDSEYIVFRRDTAQIENLPDGMRGFRVFYATDEVHGVKVVPDVQDEHSERLARAIDAMTKMSEAMGGYRNQLITQGFSAEVAERMALQAQELIVKGGLIKAAASGGNRAQRRAQGVGGGGKRAGR